MLTLVTGGSGSGKSAFAEDRVLSFGDAQRIYIATMHPFDEESHKRIERHQKMRAGKGFETVECYTGLKNVKLPAGCVVLLECMSNLVANEMFEEQGAHNQTVSEVTKGIENLLEQAAHVQMRLCLTEIWILIWNIWEKSIRLLRRELMKWWKLYMGYQSFTNPQIPAAIFANNLFDRIDILMKKRN